MNYSPDVQAAISEVLSSLPTVEKPVSYDPQMVKKENDGLLPAERTQYQSQQQQLLQPVLLKRQIVSAKDDAMVLAEALVISGSPGFNPDLAVAINDKGLKLTSSEGQLSFAGRDDVKFVDVNLQTGKKAN